MSPKSEFQNLSFRILRMKQYHCWYFTILFALLSVTVAVFFYFCCPVSLFQGRVACRNFTLKKASSMIFLQCAMHRNTTQVNN